MTGQASARHSSASKSVSQKAQGIPYPGPRGTVPLAAGIKVRPFNEALAAASARTSSTAPAPLRTQKASNLPPERLATAKNLSEEEKVTAVSQQFEAIMLRQILSEAQKPVIRSKLTNSSSAAEIYRDMATTQLADQISKTGSLGLANIFQEQLTKSVPASGKTSGNNHE